MVNINLNNEITFKYQQISKTEGEDIKGKSNFCQWLFVRILKHDTHTYTF
jgi:hypothetical protein